MGMGNEGRAKYPLVHWTVACSFRPYCRGRERAHRLTIPNPELTKMTRFGYDTVSPSPLGPNGYIRFTLQFIRGQ